MNKIPKIVCSAVLSAAMLLAFCACDVKLFGNPGDSLGGGGTAEMPDTDLTDSAINETQSNADAFAENAAAEDSSESPEYQYSTVTTVNLADADTTITGSGAEFTQDSYGYVLKLTEKSTVYILAGTLNGRILAVIDGSAQIVLNGVTVRCADNSAFAVFGSKKKVVTLADGTVNGFSDGNSYSAFYDKNGQETTESENKLNAAFYSQKNLIINGEGTLNVEGNFNNAIGCKGTLTIVSGTVNVTKAANNAIKANDYLYVKGGTINAVSDGDALKTDNEFTEADLAEDADLGSIYIDAADITVISAEDAITAFNCLYIAGGTFTVTTGGGSTAAVNGYDGETSAKGLKSDGSLIINGGKFDLNCLDDALHSNGTILISGGVFTVATDDDGIHADNIVTVKGDADINITSSYEGIEGAKVIINGGLITIVSSDDGINAADGTDNPMGQANPNCFIHITGGIIYVNASGDGIDSNGTVLIEGGEVYVDGPVSGADGALDSDGGILMNGGTLVALGSLGMVETPASNSLQNIVSFAVSGSITSGSTVELKNSDGETLVAYTAVKGSFRSVIISVPELEKGKIYAIYVNSSKMTEFSVSDTITYVGSGAAIGGQGSGQSGRPGGFGGR